MPTLSPSQSVEAASGIYDILTSTNVDRYFDTRIRNNFNLTEAKSYTAKSGFTFWQVDSGFGLAAMGKSDGLFKNEALITVRGTSKLADWVTDAHAGISITNGNLVHSGFNKVFRSFQTELSKFFIHNHPHRVHCVGHSLGGAVATLVADWVKHNTGAEPTLYTFGCPRVGSEAFAKSLTSRLGIDNIYRVSHDIDPVPMVPIWPFVHAPLPGNEYGVDYSGNRTLFYEAHFIDNYSKVISGIDTWEAVRKLPRQPVHDSKIEQWLSNHHMVMRLTAPALFLYQDALQYVLKKALYLTGIVVQGAVMSISTSLDLCAMALAAGAQASKELGGFVKNLMQKILQAVGVTIDITKDLTREFIRWVLERLMQAVYTLAKQALRVALK